MHLRSSNLTSSLAAQITTYGRCCSLLLLSFAVLSNATPYHTFLELLPGLTMEEESPLPADFTRAIRKADYSCGALKVIGICARTRLLFCR